jgi:hypothetical protein
MTAVISSPVCGVSRAMTPPVIGDRTSSSPLFGSSVLVNRENAARASRTTSSCGGIDTSDLSEFDRVEFGSSLDHAR